MAKKELTWFQKTLGEDTYWEDDGHTHDFVRKWNEGVDARQDDIKAGKAQDAMRVIIDKDELDLSDIEYVDDKKSKRFEFRPQTWEQFIGQERAKDFVKLIGDTFRTQDRSHILLTGLKGHGKTSYIELLAKTMGFNLIQRIGKSVDTPKALKEIIMEIKKNPLDSILFIDEIDTMSTEMIKECNTIVENFTWHGKKIRKFIFAGATINLDNLTINNPDFLDRIDFKIKFVAYKIPQLVTILKQVHQQLYNDKQVSDGEFTALASNCKLNPRTAIALLRLLVVDGNMQHILDINQIVKDGLTEEDVAILRFLAEQKRPVGTAVIATKMDMRAKEYEFQYEPYLFKQGYLSRTPSRAITDTGREFLSSVEEREK